MSVNRDPQDVERYSLSQVLRSGGKDLELEYYQCLQVAIKHLVYNRKEHGLCTRNLIGNKALCEINIPEFVAWATHLKWSLPPELTGYTPPPVIVAAQHVAAPVEKPLTDKERGNLHRIIAALVESSVDKTGAKKFHSEAKLIEHLADRYRGYGGISTSNLENVFSKAKQSLKE